jgi:peptidoglycan biosynthesis protein MviN/MurJ (putative lipid II flippase)
VGAGVTQIAAGLAAAARDVTVARILGVTAAADTVFYSLTAADFTRYVFGDGPGRAFLAPQLNSSAARKSVAAAVGLLLFFVVGLGVALVIRPNFLAELLLRSSSGLQDAVTSELAGVTVVLCLLAGIQGIFTIVANARRSFVRPSAASAIGSLTSIAALLLTRPSSGYATLLLLGLGFLAAAVVTLSRQFDIRTTLHEARAASLHLRLPLTVIAFGGLFLDSVVSRSFAGATGTGGLAAYGYTQRIVAASVLPIWPTLAMMHMVQLRRAPVERGDPPPALAAVLMLCALAGSFVAVNARWLASVLLGGAGQENSATPLVLAAYALGIPFYALAVVQLRTLVAFRREGTAAGLGSAFLVINIGANSLLTPSFGLQGVGFAVFIEYALGCLICAAVLDTMTRSFPGAWLRLVVLASSATVVAYLALGGLAASISGFGPLVTLGTCLFIAVAVGLPLLRITARQLAEEADPAQG